MVQRREEARSVNMNFAARGGAGGLNGRRESAVCLGGVSRTDLAGSRSVSVLKWSIGRCRRKWQGKDGRRLGSAGAKASPAA